MTARAMALALGVFLAAPLWADHAQGHGGGGSGSGGGGSRSGGGGSSSARSVSPSHGGSHSAAAPSGGSGLTPAERRHPRPGTGTGGFYGGGYGGYYGGYYPYRSFYYPYFFGSFYYGWPYAYDPFYYGGGYYGGGYYGSGGYYGGYYGAPGNYYSYRYGDRASLRVMVNPDKTRVFVDGYYAGVADDFDGLFQRLHVSPGRHEITLKLEGYRTHRMRIYVGPGATLKIQFDMVKGSGEDPVEDLAGAAGADRYEDRDHPSERDRDMEVEEHSDRPDHADHADRARPEGRGWGRLRLDVQPPDASIYVDGQFRGTARQIGQLDLPPGRHRVEIVRPGFRTEDRDVDVEGGRTRDLNVELQRP